MTVTVSQFDSPATEYQSLNELNLHELVVGEKAHAVFFSKAQGHNLRSRGIFHGDLLVANRAITPNHGDIVIAVVDGELLCRVFDKTRSLLLSDSDTAIPCQEAVIIEATVTASLRAHRPLL